MSGETWLFFFDDTATAEIYTLSLHDALPISPALTWSSAATGWRSSRPRASRRSCRPRPASTCTASCSSTPCAASRSEEHTSELQSRQYLVCRLLLEKKNMLYFIHDHRECLRQ